MNFNKGWLCNHHFQKRKQTISSITNLIIFFIIIIFMITSCASLDYENPEGFKASYSRFGDTQLNGVELSIDPETGTLTIKIEGAKSEAHALSEAIAVINKLATILAVP